MQLFQCGRESDKEGELKQNTFPPTSPVLGLIRCQKVNVSASEF